MEAGKNNSEELNSERLNVIRDLVNNSPYYKHIGMELTRFTENGCVMNMRINEETRGRIIHRGKTSAVLEADIFNESGELVAHAQTTHAIRKM